jgi:hypothetical protein
MTALAARVEKKRSESTDADLTPSAWAGGSTAVEILAIETASRFEGLQRMTASRTV